jgi:hypothetical protein
MSALRTILDWKLLVIGVLAAVCAPLLIGQSDPFISFDAPGAGHEINQGTFPVAINLGGTIAGFDFDSLGISHGFIRLPDGQFLEVNPSLSNVILYGINETGEVV